MVSIAKGGNLPIDVAAVRAVLSWTGGPGVPDVDASALLLQASGRVSGDEDFVFFNQPQHPNGAVRHLGKNGTADAVDVDLARTARRRRAGRARRVGGRRHVRAGAGPAAGVSALASGAPIAEFDMAATEETAILSGELYRRNDSWKFRAVGQGYASGLAGTGDRLRHHRRRRSPAGAGAVRPTTRAAGGRTTTAAVLPTAPPAPSFPPPPPRPRSHRRRGQAPGSERPPPPPPPPGPAPASPGRRHRPRHRPVRRSRRWTAAG